jgi:hypothetical protein
VVRLVTETDLNADLIGRVVTVEGQEFTVSCTAPWSDQYVVIEDASANRSCLSAALLRYAIKRGRA